MNGASAKIFAVPDTRRDLLNACTARAKLSLILVTAAALAACGRHSADEHPFGTWVGPSGESSPRQIVLHRGGRFEVRGFPSVAACAGLPSTSGVDGAGKWEDDVDGGRVLLTFEELSDKKCNTPYGTVVFRTPSDRLTVFLDVDRPSSAIRYEREP